MNNSIMLGGAYQLDLDKLVEISGNNVVAIQNLTPQVVDNTRRIESHDDAIAELAERLDKHERDEEISLKQAGKIRAAISSHVYKTLGIKKERNKITLDTKKKQKVYGSLFHKRMYTDLGQHFGVDDYKCIKAIEFQEALEYIRTWTPEGGVETLMREAEDNWRVNNPGQSLEKFLEVLVL